MIKRDNVELEILMIILTKVLSLLGSQATFMMFYVSSKNCHFLGNMMIGVHSFCLVSIQDCGQHPGLLWLELLACHVPGVARVDILPEGGSLSHDLLDDIIAVHLHRRVVLLRCHFWLAHCGEAMVLLSWQPPSLLQNLKIFLCLFHTF